MACFKKSVILILIWTAASAEFFISRLTAYFFVPSHFRGLLLPQNLRCSSYKPKVCRVTALHCLCRALWWAIDALRQHCLCMQFAGIFQGMEGVGTALNAVEMCDCTQLAHHHRQKFFVFKVVFCLAECSAQGAVWGIWSGRRESNPRMKLGKLPFYH